MRLTENAIEKRFTPSLEISIFCHFLLFCFLFSRGHATLHLAVSVGESVRHIFELRSVFALLLLPNRPRLDFRVSGLVYLRTRNSIRGFVRPLVRPLVRLFVMI